MLMDVRNHSLVFKACCEPWKVVPTWTWPIIKHNSILDIFTSKYITKHKNQSFEKKFQVKIPTVSIFVLFCLFCFFYATVESYR